MDDRRTHQVLTGLLSVVAGLVLLVGVPVALVAFVGWPLPAKVPDGSTVTHALRTGIPDEFVVKTLAVLAWVAWAQFAAATAVEVLAVVRRRPPRHLPVTPGMQAMAARLVAGIVMLVAPLGPVRGAAAAPPVPAVSEAPPELFTRPMIHAAPTTPSALPATHVVIEHAVPDAPSPAPSSAPPIRTVVVQRHDSYWAIAERELGDGIRWKEILELNVGHRMPDGYTITAGDEMLRAGWTLEIPADPASQSVAEPTPQPAADDSSEVVVQNGDNLWTISEQRLANDLARQPTDAEITPYWQAVIDANRDRLVEPSNPSLIYAGQTFTLPPTGHRAVPSPVVLPRAGGVEPAVVTDPTPAAPDARDHQAAPSTPSTETPPPDENNGADGTTPDQPRSERGAETAAPAISSAEGEDGADLPAAAIVGCLTSVALAVGLKRLIRSRRRAAVAGHADARPTAPSDEERRLHQAVVAMADEELADDLRLGLARLSAAVALADPGCRPRIVRHGRGSLEVLLDASCGEAPEGWLAESDGALWVRRALVDPGTPVDGPSCPTPLLVTIGQPDESANLYLDLEADAFISLVGDVDAARDLARSILTELTLSPMSDALRAVAIGDLVEADAGHLDHLEVYETWDDVADDLTSWARTSHDALRLNGWSNTFVARGAEPDHEALVPIAVVASKAPPPELAAELTAQQPSAVALVVADELDIRSTTIDCAADEFVLGDVGLSFAPQRLDPEQLESMGRLFKRTETALDQYADEVVEDAPDPDGIAEAWSDEPPPPDETEAAEPPEFDILVRLLGDIRIDGGSKPLKAKATSVVAYLAIHRSVTTESLEEACWFGAQGGSHRKRLRDVMTECRSALGSQHLPANTKGTYEVTRSIGTDCELFDWRVARAAREDPEAAAESYRAALELVTGKPFSYANAARMSYGWVDFEHLATAWEERIVGVARSYAELCLDLHRPRDAAAVLRALMPAAPLNGGLVAALIRTQAASGDVVGAEAVYQEHVSALGQADLGEPDDAVEQARLDLANG